MSMSKYMKPRSTRRESRTIAGRFRGGKLAPVMAVPFRESESGVLNQTITMELDPIAGRMITPITAELIAVYVPALAMDALKNPADDYPGNAEVFRQKLLSGNPVFSVEPEHEISKRLGIAPRSVGGEKLVSDVARLAHNCAVNYLRRDKYVKAAQLTATDLGVTPAIIGQTVLDRLNGVLDPEDRVNGYVSLSLPDMQLPVQGIGMTQAGAENAFTIEDAGRREASGNYRAYPNSTDTNAQTNYISIEGEQVAGQWYPKIEAILAGQSTGNISLSDFYTAEKMDALTREMRQMVDDNPEYGEELVARYAHGLSVDLGAQPFVMYRREKTFGMNLERAMDGASLGVTRSNMVQSLEFTVPVPPTEFGGVVVTFAVVKPDETLASQPHPILSTEWGARNYLADEMAIDPVPVTVRELNSDCGVAYEDVVALYVGNNHMMKNYVNYGFNRHLDHTTVEAKTALWQLEVPMSVTPQSVIYPETLDHYPFIDEQAEVCTYTIASMARIDTPIIFGPTPVEELMAIENENVFEDNYMVHYPAG